MKNYILRSDIIPCKGFKRTALIDIINSEIVFFDNIYFDILNILYVSGIDYVEKNLLKTLDKNNFIIRTDNPNQFPRLHLKEYNNTPFPIENSIVDRNSSSTYDIFNVINQLDELNCKYVQFRFFDYSDEIIDLVEFLNKTNSFIQNIEILTKKTMSNFKILKNLFSQNLRVNKLILFASSENSFEINDDGRILLELKENIKDCKSCGNISKNNFFINKYMYKEANNVNTCLYKKISIDINGEIKNCPSMNYSFGNVNHFLLKSVLDNRNFKKYWNTTKDFIEKCKDCEFRYVCVDCRAYTESPVNNNDLINLSKPLKCGYNPYTGKWSESWKDDPMNREAVSFYGL